MTTITESNRDRRRTSDSLAWACRPVWMAADAALLRIVTALLLWSERARQRRQLIALGDRALQDFGKSPADATQEGDKPFWRP